MPMRPQLHRITVTVCFLTGLFASGCCGPMRFHGCNTGCGELYVDPWINDPAQCSPCDACGNHNGQSCGSCRPMLYGAKTIWGYRYDGGCGCDGGCDGGCDSGCVEVAEPTCGCGVAGCDEASCGLEPTCGIEGCGGCSECSGGGHRQYVDNGLMEGESIVDESDLQRSRVVIPRSKRIFRGTAVANGSTHNHH